MSIDKKAKLITLLNYWIKHNEEHSQEFRQWAGTVKDFGGTEAGEDMRTAAQEMDKASQSLSQALMKLEERKA